MNAYSERLIFLDRQLAERRELCSSGGSVDAFPPMLQKRFLNDYIGLMVCQRGRFQFTLNGRSFVAGAGETVFLSESAEFWVTDYTDDLLVDILFYHISPIRELLGSSVMTMHLYTTLTPEPCYVWNTGEEDDIRHYVCLLYRHQRAMHNPFDVHECKLLLLSLTYRLCSIYSRKLLEENRTAGHKIDTFIQLLRLIEKYYRRERGVAFYAGKLCLSPKYLSALSKSVCGYTVQELVFRAIVRRSMLLLRNSRKTVQEISDEFNFPNASAFGTFFKKATGLSPVHYRNAEDDFPTSTSL
ncbi:helix-turn-helix domain-containing protein [uncultured Bacteroides sp.]|uniref:helix-turn-helix domain-containing protein n=1 Tax=uncultured Bacteroides sp. TaxID=162156 RepID=UPI00280BBC55|nr:helix-turn-helix domain-containing protein [uncultured Bacteroides sp.]